MGRISRSVRTTMGKTLTADYAWTHPGGIRTASYRETNPPGYALIWSCDDLGRQAAFRDSLGTPLVTSRELVHDPAFGFFERLFYPNGIVERIDHNSSLQPEHREARRSTGEYLLNLNYDFYGFAGANNGNVWGVDDLLDSSRDRFYSYDFLNRLTGVQGIPWGISYAYDRFGNRLSSQGTPSTPNFAGSLTAVDPFKPRDWRSVR